MAGVDFGRYKRIVQMIWDPEPKNDSAADQPAWCLGLSYTLTDGATKPSTAAPHPPSESAESPPSHAEPSTGPQPHDDSTAGDEGGWPTAFLDDLESRFWMTYRSSFELIPKSTHPDALAALSFPVRVKSQLVDQRGFSSDTGWGCMIRSGQSLLANALAIHRLGRNWRRGQASAEERKLISLFADEPSAPYSIHNFVRHGEASCGKYPGEWFGPSATARCIQALVNKHQGDLRVYSTGDGPDIYEDDFMRIAKEGGATFHPTLILVGTRLGIDKVNPLYWDALIASLQLPQSVGIAGGRPSSSHYFVGAQDSYLFYLDPHHTRPALPYFSDPYLYTKESVDSCHTRRVRRLHVKEMDPSMLIGFLIRSEEDWVEWRRSVNHVQGKAVISVTNRNPMYGGGEEGAGVDDVESLSEEEDEEEEPLSEGGDSEPVVVSHPSHP